MAETHYDIAFSFVKDDTAKISKLVGGFNHDLPTLHELLTNAFGKLSEIGDDKHKGVMRFIQSVCECTELVECTPNDEDGYEFKFKIKGDNRITIPAELVDTPDELPQTINPVSPTSVIPGPPHTARFLL